MSSKMELGKVEGVYFGKEDHGILTLSIHLDFGGSVQSFGGVCLDGWDKGKDRRVGTAAGLDLILKVLHLFQVASLDKIVGRVVYAHRKEGRLNEPIYALQIPEFDYPSYRKDWYQVLSLDDWRKEWFPDLE